MDRTKGGLFARSIQPFTRLQLEKGFHLGSLPPSSAGFSNYDYGRMGYSKPAV
jgi:hypothetical protein